MNVGGKLFAYGTVLYFGIGIVYWFMSGDVVGTSLLALTGGLAFLIAFYVLFTSKRVGTLPEDVETALISDADTDYGFFSPHSWCHLQLAHPHLCSSLGLSLLDG